jgi:hypothetical protein
VQQIYKTTENARSTRRSPRRAGGQRSRRESTTSSRSTSATESSAGSSETATTTATTTGATTADGRAPQTAMELQTSMLTARATWSGTIVRPQKPAKRCQPPCAISSRCAWAVASSPRSASTQASRMPSQAHSGGSVSARTRSAVQCTRWRRSRVRLLSRCEEFR